MIFKKLYFNFEFANEFYWKNISSTSGIVNERKYEIRGFDNKIIINRKPHDFLDSSGVEIMKMNGFALGKIDSNSNIIEFVVQIRKRYQIIIVVWWILNVLFGFYICHVDLNFGLVFTTIMFLFILLFYLFCQHGINLLKEELENDIKYFDKSSY